MRMKKATAETVEGSARLLKAFSDPVRLRLVNLLAGREVCVCHLHEALGLPQPTVSRHLAYLRKAGIVSGRKDGLWVHYRLAEEGDDGTSIRATPLESVAPTLAGLATMEADRERLSRLDCC